MAIGIPEVETGNLAKAIAERCQALRHGVLIAPLGHPLSILPKLGQTGRFPVTSYKGNQYVMVLFETLSNSILVEPMRSRVSGKMCRAYQTLVDRLKERSIKSTMHILVNECSAKFKSLISENEMKYQVVPHHDHRRNVTEKAVQSFKYYFVAVLCGTDDNFPLQLW